MTTLLITHPDCLQHVNPPGHAEQVARLDHVQSALSESSFDDLLRQPAELACEADLLLCHPPAYLEHLQQQAPDQGWVTLDADTNMSPGSLQAAKRAAGGVVQAVEAVMAGEADNAFCALRPPGHHAERQKSMGFCLFGNVAIGAKYALEHGLAERVAIIDFDVHHGNGTQDLLWDEPRTLFASSHQMPLYPGTGAANETGAHGTILNCPLSEGSGTQALHDAYEGQIFPAIDDFAPDLILISAGFDAHRDDPLAGLNWEVSDFIWLTQRICDLADRRCKGRIVSALEGGYDLNALAASVAAHVSVLKERGG
ncbi:MAG: acetoin utilization protein [Rhodobacterales bacterium]|nr:MAG: acetoin utilization protein [Rhodobacterales bacterium]